MDDNISVTADRYGPFGQSVVLLSGVDDTGRRVTFGADWRMARDIAEAIDAEGEALCTVPSYMILSTTEEA